MVVHVVDVVAISGEYMADLPFPDRCMCVHVCACLCACVRACVCVCLCVRVCVCVHASSIHACVYVYVYSVYCDGPLNVCPLYTYRQALIAKLTRAVNKLGKVQLK